MKICTKCNFSKCFTEFSKRAASSDGHMPECKACNSERTKRDRHKNPEKFKQWISEWRANNKEHVKAYVKANRPQAVKNLQDYRARKLQAIPKFLCDKEWDDFVMQEMYNLAKLREKFTNFKWHVDHIVPLRSRKVCGLHYHKNLRVITAKDNQMKSNLKWENQW